MGVQGLFSFLKRYKKTGSTADKRIGVDMFTLLHISKGDIGYITKKITEYAQSASNIIAVFDGSPSEERTQSLLHTAKHRSDTHIMIQQIKTYLSNSADTITDRDKQFLEKHTTELQRQAWSPSPEYMWAVQNSLVAMNIPCIVADKGIEADHILIDLSDRNLIDIVISNDSDMVANGATAVMCVNGAYYELHDILEGLQFTRNEWQIFCNLCRAMNRADPNFIFTAMKVYEGDVELIEQKYHELF
jgi:5'-3' exonuclease